MMSQGRLRRSSRLSHDTRRVWKRKDYISVSGRTEVTGRNKGGAGDDAVRPDVVVVTQASKQLAEELERKAGSIERFKNVNQPISINHDRPLMSIV